MFGTLATIVEAAHYTLKATPLLRRSYVRLRRHLKLRVPLNAYRSLHKDVIHTIRDMDVAQAATDDPHMVTARIAADLLDRTCLLLGHTLDAQRDTHQLCACVKLFVDDDGLRLGTWMRSRNTEERPIRCDYSDVDGNSVFASLTGGDDGKNRWPKFRCFCCGDLSVQNEYQNSRGDEYKKWYRSVMAFPIRFDPNTIIGVLAFDSPKPLFFGDLPNAFEYRENPAAYHDWLETCTLYHLGGIVADTLAIVLGRHKAKIVQAVSSGEEATDGN